MLPQSKQDVAPCDDLVFKIYVKNLFVLLFVGAGAKHFSLVREGFCDNESKPANELLCHQTEAKGPFGTEDTQSAFPREPAASTCTPSALFPPPVRED